MAKIKDLIGNRYERLLVISFHEVNKQGAATWLCRCDCGNEKVIKGGHLRSGDTRSCGCIVKERLTKLLTITSKEYKEKYPAEFSTWKNMKTRCFNSNNKSYKDYGARGITICERWLKSFENFIEDMGPKPGTNYSIERDDNDGNYCPENCRWATQLEQNNNTRKSIKVEYKNKVQTLTQWGLELNINREVLYKRLYLRNWSIEDALTIPTRKN